MNILTLVRSVVQKNPSATLGELYLDGKYLCDTLEDKYQETKVYSETRIPAGTFQVTLINSPKFTPIYGHEMLWVRNVPNFEGILIHPGNTEKNTAGCILVGEEDLKGMALVNSRKTYDRVHAVLEPLARKLTLYLTVVDYDRK